MKIEDMMKSPTGCPISHDAAAFDVFEEDYLVNPHEALRWSREKEQFFIILGWDIGLLRVTMM